MNSPAQIAGIFSELGVKKASTSIGKLFLLGIFAGAFIALAGVGSTIAGALVNKLAGACLFPAGLAMVILAGSELFTGDNLMIVSLLERKISLWQMVRTLVVVYLGNFAGALIVAALVTAGGVLDAFAEAAVSTAVAKASLSFGSALLKGILCNFLVCAAVWMATGAKEPVGKIVCVFLPIALFVICGYEHSVANMYFLPAGIWSAARHGLSAEGLGWSTFLLRNLLPVTLGNMIGGFALGIGYRFVYLRGTDRAS